MFVFWRLRSSSRCSCTEWVCARYLAKNKPFVSRKSSRKGKWEDNFGVRDLTLITQSWQQALDHTHTHIKLSHIPQSSCVHDSRRNPTVTPTAARDISTKHYREALFKWKQNHHDTFQKIDCTNVKEFVLPLKSLYSSLSFNRRHTNWAILF